MTTCFHKSMCGINYEFWMECVCIYVIPPTLIHLIYTSYNFGYLFLKRNVFN